MARVQAHPGEAYVGVEDAGGGIARAHASWRALPWLQVFVAFTLLCQLMLVIPGLGPLRVLLRVACFGGSVLMMLAFPARTQGHPAGKLAPFILLLLGVSLLHPDTNGVVAGVAQIVLYAAILAPLFWIRGIEVDRRTLQLVIVIYWAFHAASACVGVLQVYFPDQLTPTVSTAIAGQGDWYVEDLKIALANGNRVFRPMGLSDNPGQAATSGFYAIVLGLGLFISGRGWLRALFLSSVPIGLFCIWLSQTRSVLVMLAVCILTLGGLLVLRGEVKRLLAVLGVVGAAVAMTLAWAIAVGGDAVTGRLESLVADNPHEVYYSNRGRFLEETIYVLLPKYPLGAGLGRWGMTEQYFSRFSNSPEEMLWAEIQWTGWLYDGGVPLVILYASAVLLAIWVAFTIALDRGAGHVGSLAAVVCAYNVGALAVTFNNPLFIGSGGLDFWLLNALLFAVAQGIRSHRMREAAR